jgi:RHS repeat-associated protein
VYDPVLELYYAKARMYDADSRRFVAEDPLDDAAIHPQTMNLYLYVLDNPARYIDPDGRDIEDATRLLAHVAIANPLFVLATQHGMFKDQFYEAGFVRTQDLNGTYVYHARQDSLQAGYGYSDFFDDVFYTFTSMASDKFEFTSGGHEYVLWAWKGDYLNLGAGAELGIYTRGTDSYTELTTKISYLPTDDHWIVDKSLAMHMTLSLSYKGAEIIRWDPKVDNDFAGDNVWWATGFNPYYQNISACDLTATYSITFETKTMFKDFKESIDTEDRGSWTFDDKNRNATFIF